MNEEEILQEIKELYYGETKLMVKSQAIRDLAEKKKLWIVASEPFFYVVSKAVSV